MTHISNCIAGLAACVAIGSSASLAQAQTQSAPITTNRPASTGPRALVFDSVKDVFPSGSTKLVNGTAIVNLAAWSAVLVARLDSGDFCSATLIGPRVLLTAAHCLDAGFGDRGATVGGRVNIAGSQFTLTGCEMHPTYALTARQAIDLPRSSQDYGLCELNGAPSIVLESVAGPTSPSLGNALLMTGFGCTGIRVVSNALSYTSLDQPGSERLRMGDATIEAVAVRDHGTAAGAYLRTRAVTGEPILCPGDSGGPAIVGASLAQQTGPQRRVIGVNSMVTALPINSQSPIRYAYLSYMASLESPDFTSFLTAWTHKSPTTRSVCGVDIQPGQRNCRD